MSGSESDTSETTTISSFDLDKLSKRDRVATLVVIHGPELGTRFQLSLGRCVVGRSGTADINLADSSLSREHFEIVTEEGHDVQECRLRDLHSTNGTYIAGARVEEAVLRDGDPIRAGEVVLRFSLMDPLEDSFHREMSALIRRDSLTGLLKIGAFYEELDRALRRGIAAGSELGLLMMDIDGLKRVNDQHGHLLGSEVVRGVGACLSEIAEPRGAVTALYGGDEFIAFLAGADGEQMSELGQKLRKRVEATRMETADTAAHVSICVGVGVAGEANFDRGRLVHQADLALYKAKRSGKNRVVRYDRSLED